MTLPADWISRPRCDCWVTYGTTESIRWLDQLLASDDASPQTLVSAYYLRGWLSVLQADPAAARPWLARAVALARGSSQLSPLVEALSMSANVEDMLGNPASARHLLDEAEAIAAVANDYLATIELIQAQTVHGFFVGDLEAVTARSSEGASLSRAAGDPLLLGSMLRNLATVALLEGDLGAATARLSDALHVARQIDDRFTEYYLLSGYAWHAAGSGQARRAAQLLGAAASVGASAGADIVGPHAPFLAQARESATRALGEAKFAAEFGAGKRLTRHAAMQLALGESDERAVATPHGSEIGPLAKREVEVAHLVAEGLSNKQIAARLTLSEHTVHRHVANILVKLRLSSRAAAAAYAAKHGLTE